MKITMRYMTALFLGGLIAISSYADDTKDRYAEPLKTFKESSVVAPYFNSAYGYALFPTIGKGGIGVGGAHGTGKVFRKGAAVGNTSMTQLTIGFQMGAQAYSQIIFFQDKRAFDEFISGNFEFGAQATAVAITAGVSAQANTGGGVGAGASAKGDTGIQADTKYYKGMSVFTYAKGGLMYEATIGGQKFSYEPL